MRDHLLAGLVACLAAAETQAHDDVRTRPIHVVEALDVVATFDVLANVAGGVDRGVDVPGTLDIVGADGRYDPRGGHHAATLYLQGTFGGHITRDRVGDLQSVSSIEAPNTVKLFEAWYRYTLPSNAGWLLLGLHDLNREFYVLDEAGLLLNGSFGNGPEIAQANASLFPTTALAAVLGLRPTPETYVSLGVYDGVPGDPSDPYGTHIHFDDGDGLFAIAELGVTRAHAGGMSKLGFGAWHSSAEFTDVGGRTRDANSGAYVIAETRLPFRVLGGDLGSFLQLGVARAGRNAIDRYTGFGFRWANPRGPRPDDAFSVGVAHARLTDGYRRAAGIAAHAETAIEVTYAWHAAPWLTLQPDVHVVIDPAGGGNVDDALVLGLRVTLDVVRAFGQ